MTEQEITQARADLEQLDIEQLRCGVMLQLLKIEALTKERDALAAAAKLAMDALEKSTRYFNIVRLGESRLKDSEIRGASHTAMSALRQAGVQ